MARLTGTQKKKRNQFIALLIAIVVVLAAIFYVAYSAFMAKSSFLASEDFATALGSAFGKSVRSVSEEDLASVKYLEIMNYGDSAAVTIGDKAFVDAYDKYEADYDTAVEAGEDTSKLTIDTSSLKFAEFEAGDELTLNDIKYFTGVENANFSGVSFDINEVANWKELRKANFSGCGFDNDDIKLLAEKLDLEKVEKLVFMGNSVDDWSPLESISDKVSIQNYTFQLTEDGQYTVVPVEQTLTEYLEEQAKAEAEAAEDSEEATEETVEETTEEVVEEATEEATEEVTE